MTAPAQADFRWFNEPPSWSAAGEAITLTTAPKTDFWRKTHYGFIRDNGHFYYQHVSGDFTMDVKFSGNYNALYDHAGFMVRLDAENWLKTGIEYVQTVQHMSAVVTRDFSDWSVVRVADNPPAVWLHLTRIKEAIEIKYSFDGAVFTMLRMLYFPPAATLDGGIMAASPEGNGFTVTFEGLNIHPAAS